MSLEHLKTKPTLDKPTKMGKATDKTFTTTLKRNNVSLDESENMLNEKEQSLKKKIFDLSKMESLVHGDEKLSAIYNEMAEDGEEKYGYHYNESIMNIIFNEYILNSVDYLQKYKMAIPKEKKRRDKSGIKQLQQAGEEEMEKKEENENDNNLLPGVAEDITETPPHSFTVDQSIDPELRIRKIENKYDTMEEPIKEDNVDETTSAGGSAGGVDGSSRADGYSYVGPFGSKRNDKLNKPAWDGGTVLEGVNESEYFTNPTKFKEYADVLDSGKHSDGLDSPNNDSLVPMAEDHVQTREDKINYIIQQTMDNNESLSGGDFDAVDDTTIDQIYDDLELQNESINETNTTTREQKLDYLINHFEEDNQSVYPETPIEWLKSLEDSALDALYQNAIEIGSEIYENIDEKAESKAQQRFMGMVRGLQRGDIDPSDVGASVEKAAAEMKPSDVKDFATTKHKGLPEKKKETNEDEIQIDGAEENGEQQIDKSEEQYVVEFHSEKPGEVPFEINDEKWKYVWAIYPDGKKDIGAYKINSDLVYNYEWFMDYIKKNSRPVVETMIDKNPESMSMGGDNPTSMKLQRPINQMNTSGMMENVNEDGQCRKDEVPVPGKSPHEKGACKKKTTMLKVDPEDREKNPYNIKKREERLKKYETSLGKKKTEYGKELEKHKKQTEKLKESTNMNEDRKHTSMVNLDRLKSNNASNFTADMKNKSNTGEVINKQKELTAKDQITQVDDNPYKLGEKIEKEALKQNKGEALENVGDSTNDNNKEIPKRNLTDDENEDIKLERGLGMQDIVYDNEPSERFEKRMEQDMGDEIYKQRQEKMKHRAKAPTYNKDTQPMEDGVDKDQFEKNKDGWNKRKGIDESLITGKYKNEFNQTKFIDFKLSEVNAVDKIDESWFTLNFDGLGNRYDNKVNESTKNDALIGKFYTDSDKIYNINNPENINENEEKNVINEEFNKMKHLMNYKPEKFVKTDGVKRNRRF